jgi:hypothetical protein
MKLIIFIVIGLLLNQSGFAGITHTTWKGYLEHQKGSFADLFPDGQYIETSWRTYSEFNVDGSHFPPNKIQILPLTCAKKNLYPTNPQQNTKVYIYGVYSNYNHVRLPGTSSSCITPSFNKKHCLRAQSAVVAVMSDVYQDSCGNFYRGYWRLNYRIGGGPQMSEDTMGTLFSKGRTVYEKPNSSFPGKEFVDGDTYPVDVKNFMFLGSVLPGDQQKVKNAQAMALRSGYTLKNRIWYANPLR